VKNVQHMYDILFSIRCLGCTPWPLNWGTWVETFSARRRHKINGI
jgi:hypothetical protein